MDISMERYGEAFREQWENYVFTRAKNATFLHSRAFYDHNPQNEAEDHSLVFFKKGKLLGLFAANAIQTPTARILNSYSRSTYGGFVVDNKVSVADLISMTELLIDHATQEGFDQIIVRPSFRIYHSSFADEQDYVLWMKGFSIRSRELELAIELKGDIRKGYDEATLRNVKKAAKTGVTVREDANDLGRYWGLLTRNLADRHQVRPVHNLEEIEQLIRLVGSEKVKLFSAYLDDKIVGGILVFIANKKVAHAQYIAWDATYQDYRPINAVIDHIAHWAQQEGFEFFNLGMATEPGGHEINPGLFRFKEGFGGRSVLRETMQLHLNNKTHE